MLFEALGKWFVDHLWKIFHVKFLVYAHWFMSIIISQLKDHSFFVNQDRYATSIVVKYLDADTVNSGTNFYKITLRSAVIFTKAEVSTSY